MLNALATMPRARSVRTAALALALAITVPACAFAQTAFTLDAALAYALAHHPQLRAASSRIDAARIAARVPGAGWLPTVGAAAEVFAATANNSTAAYLNTPYLALPRVGATRAVRDVTTANWSPYGSSLVGIGLSQEIYDFGRIAAQTALADAVVETERHRADDARLAIELGVREAFYTMLTARAVLSAATDAVQRARVHRDLASAWVAQGLRARIEIERAEADLARADVGRIRAEGGVMAARAAFATSVGLDAPMLDAVGEPAAPAPLPSLDAAVREAGAHDPAVLIALARVREQEARTQAIGTETRPNVSLTASLDLRAGGAPPTNGDANGYGGVLPVVPNYDIGVLFNWPIYDATVLARRTASQRTEDVTRVEVDVARQTLAANIARAWMDVTLAASTVPALERAVAAAIANESQADARFRSGLGTSVELVDAEALRTDAEIQLALGRFEIARARARFTRVASEAP